MRRSAWATAWLLMAARGVTALAQPPTVEETTDQIAVANSIYRVTIVRAQGGLISRLRWVDGATIMGEHALYTDQGIYPGRENVSSAKEPDPEVRVRREGNAVTVTSRGLLRGDGDLADPEKRLEYQVSYRFDASGDIEVAWTATPSFSQPAPSGFFSYLMRVPRLAEWFAQVEDGVVFSPASGANDRSFQSALEPFSLTDPWLGWLLDDGGIIALSALQAEPGFANVFLHEGVDRSAGVFCAWLSGGGSADLVPGEPWSAGFRLHLWPRAVVPADALPDFLR